MHATQRNGCTAAERNALREHVLAVWRDIKAEAHVYRCVQALAFLTPRAPRHPAYAPLLERGRAAAAAGEHFAVADVGCCFGQDTRALIADGLPPSCCVAADLHDTYWRAGLRLFGDVDCPSRLAGVRCAFGNWAAPADATSDPAAGLARSLDGCICMFVLHVLSREQCMNLLARLARCAKPGAVLLGAAVGAREAGEWARTPDCSAPRWLHSEATLADALRASGWDGTVDVRAAAPGEWDEGGSTPMLGSHASAGGALEHVLRLQFTATKAAL